MSSTHRILILLAVALVGASPAAAKVTILQNGASPDARYDGCKDTWISGEQWETGRDFGKSGSMRTSGKRHILIRFDLAPLGKDPTVGKAVLRLADAGYPRPDKEGQYAPTLKAYALVRAWNENANWLEHTRTNYREQDDGDWKVPGGEIGEDIDFGADEKGMIAVDTVYDGPWGHAHELDVTAVVKQWASGKLANHGLLLKAPDRSGALVASSDWPIPEFRPQLIVDTDPAGKDIAPLTRVGKEIEPDPIAKTEDPGKPADKYDAVRVGQNANCQLRGESTSTYVKANVAQYPGPWGWMTECRVGGPAGDVDRTVLYFDLSGLPKNASVKSAKLVCTLVDRTSRQIRSYRYGVFMLKLPETPGWSAAEAVATERAAGKPWPGGSVAACSSDKPIAIGTVTQSEIERQGRKQKVDSGIVFDVTGAVRAWLAGKAPNCGLALDNRIEGGQYDIHSSRSFDVDARPYLEIEIAPGVSAKAKPIKGEPKPPAGDYWVEPMRKVHATFDGTKGTFAQYGDSITVTGAFLANFGWAGKVVEKITNATPEAKADADLVEKYCNIKLWRQWKEGGYGNTGMMMSDWLFRNIDGWQKKMDPEVSVIMFGTNDIGGIVPPQYSEYMAASCRRMLADGTVPMLTSIPPAARGWHEPYRLAAVAIADGLKIPLIDYQGEILRRRPEDWNGRLEKFNIDGKNAGYNAETLVSGDGTHPSNPAKYVDDWSEEGLNTNGYNLRNYMTIRMYAEIIRKVLQPGGPGEAKPAAAATD